MVRAPVATVGRRMRLYAMNAPEVAALVIEPLGVYGKLTAAGTPGKAPGRRPQRRNGNGWRLRVYAAATDLGPGDQVEESAKQRFFPILAPFFP